LRIVFKNEKTKWPGIAQSMEAHANQAWRQLDLM